MLQEVVLEHLVRKYKNPTYKKLVELTGIEQTRMFRIKNGCHMRIDEFEKILGLIEDEGLSLDLFFNCYRFLDMDTIKELEQDIRRKITISQIKRGA